MDFFRSWSSYKAGFGSQESEFWLGNENLHQLTLQGKFPARSRELEGHSSGVLGSEDSPSLPFLPPLPGTWELCVELEDFNGNHTFAHYESFRLLGEADHYQLVLGKFLAGTAGEQPSGGALEKGEKAREAGFLHSPATASVMTQDNPVSSPASVFSSEKWRL